MEFFKKNEQVSQQEIDDALSPLDDMISSAQLAGGDATGRDVKVLDKTLEGVAQPFGRKAGSMPLSSRLFEKDVEETQFSPVSARPSRPAPPGLAFAPPPVPLFPASLVRPTPYVDRTPAVNVGHRSVPPPPPVHRSAPPPSTAHGRSMAHSAPPPRSLRRDEVRIDDREDVTSYRPSPVSRRGAAVPLATASSPAPSSAAMSDLLRSDPSTGDPSVVPPPPSTVHGLSMSVNSERGRSPKRSMKGWAAAFVSVGVLGGAAAGLVLHFEQAKLAAAAMADQMEVAPAVKISPAAAAPASPESAAESVPVVPGKAMSPVEAAPTQEEAPVALLSNFVQPSSPATHEVPAAAPHVAAKATVVEVKKPAAVVRTTRWSSKASAPTESGKLMAMPKAADNTEKKEEAIKAEAKAAKKNVSATEANELAKQQLEAALGGSD